MFTKIIFVTNIFSPILIHKFTSGFIEKTNCIRHFDQINVPLGL